jgi:hypothetical protein
MGQAMWLRKLCMLGASTERFGACSGTVELGALRPAAGGLLLLMLLAGGAWTAAAMGCISSPLSMSCSLHRCTRTGSNSTSCDDKGS